MQYEVTLYWHDGGSIFLGCVNARNASDAEQDALDAYTSQSKKQRREIEEGGSFELDAVPA